MSNKKMNTILEGLSGKEKVDEGVTFKKNKEYELTKDFGDLKKGTPFMCNGTDNYTVSLTRSDKKSYSIKIPLSIADGMFKVYEF